MRYYRVESDGRPRVVVRTADGAYDLTSARGDVTSYRDLVRAAAVAGLAVDDVADRLVTEAEPVPVGDGTAVGGAESTRRDGAIGSASIPVSPDEVWAAGVTYQISEEAREAESEIPHVYREVYESGRPEIFFKATPDRTVGPGDAVGIRSDSDWDVPEPELAVVLYRGEIVGYTIGNDVSSRGIEGENPLYLPQAKIYDRCCSIGPCVTSTDGIGDPHELEIEMSIRRDGEEVFAGAASTAEMAETCQDLVDCFNRCNVVPEVAVLLTGTAIVPEDSFTLTPGDTVSIDVDGIGTLRNEVTRV